MNWLPLLLASLEFSHPTLAANEAGIPWLPASLLHRTAYVRGPQQKVKIMPLGDSITWGTRDPGYGGYRHMLGMLLANGGYSVDFVGSRQSGNGVIGSPGNEGHPGWTIPQIKDGIDSRGWLETYQPDIILLHIGTNDITHHQAPAAPANLAALLDDILVRLPRAHVIVAQIIPFRRGPERVHQAFNDAVAAIVSTKGPRVAMVDMQNILSAGDYADGLHPNAGGYDKMARAWEPAIRAVLASSDQPAVAQPPSGTPAGEDVKSRAAAPAPGTEIGPVIRYISGSTRKLEQLLGDEDKERHQRTRSQTVTRYGLQGTDLGNFFEHEGRVYFLFGDTVGLLDRALDTIATTDATNPEQGVRLDS